MKIIYPEFSLREQYQFGVAIMVRDRPYYVKRCFNSLKKSDLTDTLIIVLDDASENTETFEFVKNFSIPDVPIIKILLSKHINFNLHNHLKLMWDMLSEKYDCQYLCVLDSDMIVKQHWLKALYTLHEKGKQKHGKCIVSGFNNCSRRVISCSKEYRVTPVLGGANMFFGALLYHQMVRYCLCNFWDEHLCKAVQSSVKLLITHPSVCQHIGKQGLFSGGNFKFDFALDYSWADTICYSPFYLCRGYWPMPLSFYKSKFFSWLYSAGYIWDSRHDSKR